jgi:polyphosphate kinase 2 (PPK2 family)
MANSSSWQLWVVAKGLKVVVIFEGRDGAGKGAVRGANAPFDFLIEQSRIET